MLEDVTLVGADGKPTEIRVLFCHEALYRLDADHGLALFDVSQRLRRVAVSVIETVLLVGLEGHRERRGGRDRPWTRPEVRKLLEEQLAGVPYVDLADQLDKAMAAGARRGKALPPRETTPASE